MIEKIGEHPPLHDAREDGLIGKEVTSIPAVSTRTSPRGSVARYHELHCELIGDSRQKLIRCIGECTKQFQTFSCDQCG